MSLWQNFLHFITLRPMPLSDSWRTLEANCLGNDENAPVLLKSVVLTPDKLELRKYVSPLFVQSKINEVTDLLMFYSTQEAHESPAFLYLRDLDAPLFGDITIIWHPLNGNEKKGGLQIKTPEDMDETLEFALKKSLTVILSCFKRCPQVGFTLEYRLACAHPNWQVPEKFKELSF